MSAAIAEPETAVSKAAPAKNIFFMSKSLLDLVPMPGGNRSGGLTHILPEVCDPTATPTEIRKGFHQLGNCTITPSGRSAYADHFTAPPRPSLNRLNIKDL